MLFYSNEFMGVFMRILGVSKNTQTFEGNKFYPSRNNIFAKNVKETTFLILSDIDGTWKPSTPDGSKVMQTLNNTINQITERCKRVGMNVFFGYVTARPPARTINSGVTPPHLTITYNGGLIHENSPSKVNAISQKWDKLNKKSNFDSVGILGIISDITKNSDKYKNMKIKTVGEVVGNSEADECKYISTICIPTNSISLDKAKSETTEIFNPATYQTPNQIREFMNELEAKFKAEDINYKMSPAYLFSGKPYVMFDVAAPHANKGDAVNYVARNLNHKNLIIAGDGGNDISMMDDDGRNVIIVGHDKVLREKAGDLKKDNVIMRNPDEPSSLGVLNGIIDVLKQKAKDLYKKGLISAEPDLNNFQSPKNKPSSAEMWEEYYRFKDDLDFTRQFEIV